MCWIQIADRFKPEDFVDFLNSKFGCVLKTVKIAITQQVIKNGLWAWKVFKFAISWFWSFESMNSNAPSALGARNQLPYRSLEAM